MNSRNQNHQNLHPKPFQWCQAHRVLQEVRKLLEVGAAVPRWQWPFFTRCTEANIDEQSAPQGGTQQRKKVKFQGINEIQRVTNIEYIDTVSIDIDSTNYVKLIEYSWYVDSNVKVCQHPIHGVNLFRN